MFLIGLELYLKECQLMQESLPSGVLIRLVFSSVRRPYLSGALSVRRPAGYVIRHQKGSTSQDGDFKSPKHE